MEKTTNQLKINKEVKRHKSAIIPYNIVIIYGKNNKSIKNK